MPTELLPVSKYDVFDHMNIGVIVLEQDPMDESEFYIRYLNKRVEKFSPNGFQHLINQTVKKSFPKAYKYKMHLAFIKCLQTQQPIELGEMLYGDEKLHPQYIDMQLVPEGHNRLIIYYNNITKHLVKIKELEIKNKELTHFAHVVSHDLVEPINTTQGYIEILNSKLSETENTESLKYTAVIDQSAKRMKKMVTQLLDYSKLNINHHWEPINTTLLIHNVVDDLGHLINTKKAQIFVSILPEIHGHPTQIRALFQNLITNGLKFQKEGEAPKIEIGFSDELDFWHFYVKDNGIGIASKNVDRIFLMFEKLNGKDSFSGSGIGLAHCQKIVKLHQGELWVESELGNGATFHFRIPKEPIIPK